MGENNDIERLIVAVEKRVCLWNSGTEEYHDRQKKDLAWEDVCAEILGNTWISMEVEERKKICADIKKKWNNLRDSYRRDVNKIKSTPTGSGAKKTKKYIYVDLLEFLHPILEKRNHSGNYTDEENNQNISNILDVEGSSTEESTPKRKKRKETDVPLQILNLIKEKRQEKNDQHEDDDEKYLLSFRTDLKAMTKSQKIEFKIGMLQLLRKITDPQYGHNSQSYRTSRPENPNIQTSYLHSPSPNSNYNTTNSNFSNSCSPSPPATYDRGIVYAPSATSCSTNIKTMHTMGSVPLFLRPTLPRQQETTSTMNSTETISLYLSSTPAQQQQQESQCEAEKYIDDDIMSIYLKYKDQDSV